MDVDVAGVDEKLEEGPVETVVSVKSVALVSVVENVLEAVDDVIVEGSSDDV